MRRPNLSGIVVLFIVGACATGESLGDATSGFEYDAGDGSVGYGSGGVGQVQSGGFPGTGGSQVPSGGSGSTMGSGGKGSGGSPNSGGEPNSGGKASTGGTTSSGGSTSTGGKASSGGMASTGGAAGDGGSQCPTGEKFCNSKCAVPNPGTGCGLTGCTACNPAPANGVVQCVAASHTCDFVCYSGFHKNSAGTGCDPDNPGTGGSTGGGSCVPSACPKCGFAACCNASGNCGCNWVVCV